MAIVFSILSAVCFSAAALYQLVASKQQLASKNMKPTLLISLFQHGGWLIGLALDAVAVIFQIIALSSGSVVVVQPIIALGLVASVLAAPLFGVKRPDRASLLMAFAGTMGVALFVIGRPVQAGDHYRGGLTVIASILVLAVSVCVSLLPIRSESIKATLQAVGGALLVGYASVLERELGINFHRLGLVGSLTSMPVISLVAVGAVGLLVTQSAFQLGELHVVLPIFSVGEPIVALLGAKLILGERIFGNGIHAVGQLAGLTVALVALLVLAFRTLPSELEEGSRGGPETPHTGSV